MKIKRLPTSREERLAKAEAPSEASLLLTSSKERLPGGKRWRGGREESPRSPQSTARLSEEQTQGGGHEEVGNSSAARRLRTRATNGGEKQKLKMSYSLLPVKRYFDDLHSRETENWDGNSPIYL